MKRLGEILTELEWVSPAGLAQALATQEVLGGRIGTCMLEVEAVSEERLMAGLVRQLQVPAARTRDLTNIPKEVLGLLPKNLAIESQAIPFRMLGSHLHVALLDVHDRVLIENLTKLSEKTIVPHIANESRLFQALASGYRCPVSERFRQLIKQLDDGDDEDSQEGSAAESTAVEPSPVSKEEAVLRDVARLAQDLAAADDRDVVASLLLGHLEERYEAAALFVLRRGEFRGWRGAGKGLDAKRLAALQIDSEKPSVLAHLTGGARYHAGPVTPNETHRAIAGVWNSDVPRDALVLPVQVAGKLAMAIWCVPEAGTLDAPAIEEAEKVSELAGETLARLISEQRQRG